MKTKLTLFFLWLIPLAMSAAEPDFSHLDSLMTRFFVSMEKEDIDAKNAEADFLIGSCRDSLIRQHVALTVFDHYRDSRVMGEESVAIHVYDDWFVPGRVSFQGELDRMDAEVFVRFNRNSQLGFDAPELCLYNPCGKKIQIPEKGRTSILFFYDTHCSKCKLELQLLPSVLKDVDFDINLYLVNSSVGGNRKEWKSVIRNVRIKNKHVRVLHLWDPDLESGYELEYGVIATPRVFMVEPQGVIIGRRLEMDNIPQMLSIASAIQAAYEKIN